MRIFRDRRAASQMDDQPADEADVPSPVIAEDDEIAPEREPSIEEVWAKAVGGLAPGIRFEDFALPQPPRETLKQVIGDRVLVLPDPDLKEKDIGGGRKLLTGTSVNEASRTRRGTIVKAGIMLTGPWLSIGSEGLKPGDRVIFGRYAGIEVELGGTRYIALNWKDIILTFTEEAGNEGEDQQQEEQVTREFAVPLDVSEARGLVSITEDEPGQGGGGDE